jgi:hypothetical protein
MSGNWYCTLNDILFTLGEWFLLACAFVIVLYKEVATSLIVDFALKKGYFGHHAPNLDDYLSLSLESPTNPSKALDVCLVLLCLCIS